VALMVVLFFKQRYNSHKATVIHVPKYLKYVELNSTQKNLRARVYGQEKAD
jgi:hypothetical protein